MPMNGAVRPDPARNWRDRVSIAACAEDDQADPTRTRQLVDRAVAAAGLVACLLGLLGAVVGFTTAGELLRRSEGPVHAAAALAVLAGGPWLLIILRGIIMTILRRRGGGLIGRLVPATARTVAARGGEEANRNSGIAAAGQLGRMLAGPSGRWLASFGSGLFWCGYAAAAIAAIWLLTARVALGFGWESSWLPPELGRQMVETTAAPLQPLLGDTELQPVNPPPLAAADDDSALALRRAWVIYLSGGVMLYLLLPMGLWTVFAAAMGHLAAERWRPKVDAPQPTTPLKRKTTTPAAPASTRALNGDRITTIVGLERPSSAKWPPPTSDFTGVLQIVHDGESLNDATAQLSAESETRTAIIAWLPATPDRGARRMVSTLANASGAGCVLVLDGGDALRTRESAETVRIRHADWSRLADACNLPIVEFDLSHLTDQSRTRWLAFLEGRTVTFTSDIARLDESFAAISAALDADPPLPDERAAANLAREISSIHGASGAGVLAQFTDAIRDGGRDPIAAAKAVAERGRNMLPARLRGDVRWAAIGGVLGALACVGATVAAPAAAVALPAWAMSGAGLGGVLGLLRKTPSSADGDGEHNGNTTDLALGESVLAATLLAVLLWKQGEGEQAVDAALLAAGNDAGPPVLADAHQARNWLASVRARLAEDAAT